ncbi:hypothetical protein ACJZ2D_014187 [Fusarium nematophilum]
MSHRMADDMDGEMLPVRATTTPPWLRQTHVVRIVDLRANSRETHGITPFTERSTPESDCGIETGIFVQTSQRALGGVLYIPRQQRGTSKYQLVVRRYVNLLDNNLFDSESPIGVVYKKDFNKDFMGSIRSVPLPESTRQYTQTDSARGEIWAGIGQGLPPLNSTD